MDTEGNDIEEGDFVVVSNKEDWVKMKQKDHGGWVPSMQKVNKQLNVYIKYYSIIIYIQLYIIYSQYLD